MKTKITCTTKSRSIKLNVCILTLIITAAVFFSSCKKENKNESDNVNIAKKPSFSAITDNAVAESVFSDVFNQSGKASKDAEAETGNKNGKSVLTGCPTITISPFDLTWPKVITVDFGQTNCLGSDGRNRRGIINIHATEGWRTPGSVTTITFTNYYVDNNKVEGIEIITNNGRNLDSNLVYTVDVQNAKITKPDNTFIMWNSLRQHEWIAGEPTILDPYDDAYLITGNVTGTSSGGDSYTIVTVTPLNILFGCQWIRAGIIDINIQGLPTIRVDYGNGTCDGFADAIVNGVTYPIVMQ